MNEVKVNESRVKVQEEAPFVAVLKFAAEEVGTKYI